MPICATKQKTALSINPEVADEIIMTLVRNKPEKDGWELGSHLHRFCEAEIEKYSGSGLAVPERCGTCAFREGTFPNGCVTTVMDALKSVLERDKTVFLCHEHKRGDPAPVCAGYLLLAGKEREAVRANWKFSDEYSNEAENQK